MDKIVDDYVFQNNIFLINSSLFQWLLRLSVSHQFFFVSMLLRLSISEQFFFIAMVTSSVAVQTLVA
jgi:hypothetical protein